MDRKTASTITDDDLTFLYDLLEVRYPFSTTVQVVATFTVYLATPKARPRVTRGNTYTPAATTEAETTIAWAFRQAAREHRADSDTRFGLLLSISGAHPCADADNLAKTIMDALNGVAWGDDKQVDELHVYKHPGRKRTTEVTVYRIGGGGSLVAYWLDEGWHSWPEIVEAGTAAAGLYARCGSYIADHRTDGVISSGVVRMYGTSEWAQRLVDVGLWTVCGAGYRDERYFPLNKSAADIAALRKGAAERQRVSRSRRKPDLDQRLRVNHTNVTRDSQESSRVTHDAPIPPPKGGIGGGGERASPRPCPRHRGQPAHNCAPCRSEQLGGD